MFPTIGVDAVDLEACAERGLIVANGATPENFLAMSEATVMLMLVLLYRLHRSERLLRENAGAPAADVRADAVRAAHRADRVGSDRRRG